MLLFRTTFKVIAESAGISALLLTAATVLLGVTAFDLWEMLSELALVLALGVFLFWYYVMLLCRKSKDRH
ncbi:MAG: hypothetical protein SWE60_01405 [Thermodesulfobacteriota bacterium]|nr:hypothetical protein [Thermodesulfobacteriota bacterium]